MTKTELLWGRWLTVTLLMLGACGDGLPEAAPSTEPTTRESAAPSSSAAAASASVAPAPATVPLLKLVKAFPDELKSAGSVYQLTGNLLVVDGRRVMRVVGSKLELVAERQDESPFGGQVVISWLGGSYPDAIDMIGYFSNGRAPAPHVGPLMGKGDRVLFGGGGGYGHVAGVGYRDGSAVIMGEDWSERRIVTIRGKALPLSQTGRLKVGCPAEKDRTGAFLPAVDAQYLGSSKDGTIVSLGKYCNDPEAAVEVWPREGEAKVIKITEWKKAFSHSGQILSGADRVWIKGTSDEPILELKNLALRALPRLKRHVNAFVGPDDTLYASDGDTIHHLVGEGESLRWDPVATLVWPTTFETLTLHEGRFWGSASGAVHKLEQGEPLALAEACKTPFVYLYDVKTAEPGYSFPTTKKALRSFDRKKESALVEFSEGNRRLGLKVPDRAAGEAALALIKTHMQDEEPRLICYEPSLVLRTHPLL